MMAEVRQTHAQVAILPGINYFVCRQGADE